MKTNIEDLSSVKKKLSVEVGADLVSEARVRAIQLIQKEAKLPGFRPGKVPTDILQKQFQASIDKQTIEEVIDQTLPEAFSQAQLKPISRPEITPGLFGAGGGFSYTATFEILPAIKVEAKDFEGLKLEKKEVQVSDEELEKELLRLQQMMTQLEPLPKETTLEVGHVAVVDYRGEIDGKTFKGGEAKDFLIDVGQGNLLKDFEEGIKGMKEGESKKLSFSYPQDYFNKELAGKKADFHIQMKSIRKKNIPPLNDDFAKDVGPFQNLNEVREDLKKRVREAKEHHQKEDLYGQILKELVKHLSFDLPSSLVYSELRHMLEDLAKDLSSRGEDIKNLKMEEVVGQLSPEAEFRVRSFLILNEVALKANLEVKESEIEDYLTQIAKSSGRPLPEVRAHYEQKNLLDTLKLKILHEKTLEFVLNKAKIKIVKASPKEKMKKT